MISSMTGYGRGELSSNRVTAVAEIRSVNSRFLEVTSRLPRTMSLRENDVKELVRTKFSRGKVNVVLNVTHENDNELPLKINKAAAKAYLKLLTDLKKSVKLKDKITLEHLLKFQDIIEIDEFEKGDEREWLLLRQALTLALDEAVGMRRREGEELMKDLSQRVKRLDEILDMIERLAQGTVPEMKSMLEERLRALVSDQSVIDAKRLEMELALYADKLDITEECVRFRSHNKFFMKAMREEDAAGRKLNFLVQEMNREANTIGSKTNHAEVAHLVVGIKEELEKIREQLQNIE
ncbi:MAG TPA: YicC/YloC family endoribonuclease [Bacteroidota bacterium]|nr:YicC/YloC family endoribonuclease [Bacteroidota bacterium]